VTLLCQRQRFVTSSIGSFLGQCCIKKCSEPHVAIALPLDRHYVVTCGPLELISCDVGALLLVNLGKYVMMMMMMMMMMKLAEIMNYWRMFYYYGYIAALLGSDCWRHGRVVCRLLCGAL